jgi:hypothetical protein
MTLLDERNSIVTAVVELREVFPEPLPAFYRGRRLGSLAIKEAYIYPEIAAPRLSFTVSYHRNGNNNQWTAAVRSEQLFRGIRSKGAVSYTTASHQGETEVDQRFANVGVLVEMDPRFDRPEILDQPDFKKMTADQARRMADEMFRSRHPDAVIEPEVAS